MKKIFKVLAIIALVAVIGFSMACGGGDDGITPVSVTGVTLNKSITSINKGSSETLTATVAPENATNKTVTWSSSDETVATVVNGKVTAVAAGSATITVTTVDGNKTAACSVTVNDPSLLTFEGTISISPSGTVAVNTQLTATYNGTETVTLTYQWKNGSANVGTNSSKHTPTAEGSYTVTISATGYNPKTSEAVSFTSTGGGGDTGGGDPISGFTTIAAFTTWLSTQPANSAAEAYNVKLNVSDLGGSYSTAGSVGKLLYDNRNTKYVSLDLSGSNFTTIGGSAFYGCTSLTSITIGNSVTSIGGAFSGCTSLTAINVDADNNSYSSQDGVLYNKDKTTLVAYPAGKTGDTFTIPSSVTSISSGVFSDSNLTAINVDASNTAYSSQDGILYNKAKTAIVYVPKKITGAITIPNSVTSIWSYFSGCTSLANITIGSGVTSIESYAFSGCTSLASVTIGSGVTSIGSYAFSGCTSLASVTLPTNASFTAIRSDTFSGCTSLTSITIPNSVIYINFNAFRGLTSLTSITIPNSVTTIESYAFSGCGLTSVTFTATSKVTSIGDNAFSSCTNLTSITIPNSVTSIGSRAFSSCTKLASVTIGSGVTSIGSSAFSSCTSLTSVTFEGTIPSSGFHSFAFGESGYTDYIGDLRSKYFAAGGGIGTYTRPNTTSTTWTKKSS